MVGNKNTWPPENTPEDNGNDEAIDKLTERLEASRQKMDQLEQETTRWANFLARMAMVAMGAGFVWLILWIIKGILVLFGLDVQQ